MEATDNAAWSAIRLGLAPLASGAVRDRIKDRTGA
jgi:hypothetical protein